MNAVTATELHRLERLTRLLQQDPYNTLLLADTAQAALEAGRFDEADQLIAQGSAAEGDTPAWRFRLASLRIAQRQLARARELLEGLPREGAGAAAVEHNLAYIDYLQGDPAACAQRLQPWVDGAQAGTADAGPMQTLWLRAQHRLGRLDAALAWVRGRGPVRLPPDAVGVASLVAVDAGQAGEAEQWSALALQSRPGQLEASIARACLAMSRGAAQEAEAMLQSVAGSHAHQPRAWSALGLAALLQGRHGPAREAFSRALALSPDDGATQSGLGWACLMQGDLAAAHAAFDAALAADSESADAHGGLAIVLASTGDRDGAASHAKAAEQLQPGHLAARCAGAILTGDPKALDAVHRLGRQWAASLWTGRRPG